MRGSDGWRTLREELARESTTSPLPSAVSPFCFVERAWSALALRWRPSAAWGEDFAPSRDSPLPSSLPKSTEREWAWCPPPDFRCSEDDCPSETRCGMYDDGGFSSDLSLSLEPLDVVRDNGGCDGGDDDANDGGGGLGEGEVAVEATGGDVGPYAVPTAPSVRERRLRGRGLSEKPGSSEDWKERGNLHRQPTQTAKTQ